MLHHFCKKKITSRCNVKIKRLSHTEIRFQYTVIIGNIRLQFFTATLHDINLPMLISSHPFKGQMRLRIAFIIYHCIITLTTHLKRNGAYDCIKIDLKKIFYGKKL